jgi:hypothetical protein
VSITDHSYSRQRTVGMDGSVGLAISAKSLGSAGSTFPRAWGTCSASQAGGDIRADSLSV